MLTYTVETGSAKVMTGPGDDATVVRKLGPGDTARVKAGQWLREEQDEVHHARNAGTRADRHLPRHPAPHRRAGGDPGLTVDRTGYPRSMSEGTRDPDQPATSEPRSEPQDPLRRSRTSGAWVAVVAAAVLLILLVVFIAQNTDDTHISFLWWDGEAPLSVALLGAAVIGIALTAVVGTMRIWQLRRRVRRDRP